MAAIIQFRRDTAANWTSNNPTLAVGEIGYETDNERYKIGDGSTVWTSLGYGGLGDISKHLIDAKGDLIVGTADNTAGRLAAGSDGQHLVADSSAAGGVSWETSTESIEDVVGAQIVTNGSHTGITATYDDAGDGAIDLALVTENVQDIVAGQLVTNGSHSGIAATYDDGGDGAIDLNVDDFTITLAGDLSGNATITNLADATLTATIVADATALGTDTTGDYVESLVAGTGVTLTNNSGETATPTVAIGQAVGASDTPTFGSVTISSSVANATHAATKAYVDNAIAGLDWHEAVNLGTAAALPNTPTYNNGTAGVGATLTSATQVRLVIDGANATTGNRILVQDQATGAHNGIYDVTAQGVSGSAVWVLTRATDFDGTPTGEIKAGEAVYVLAGSSNNGQGFVVTSTSDPHTVGTHDIDFTQFTGTQAFTAGTDLTITGNTINHDASGVSAASYGSATQVPGYTVDAQGHLTAAANTTIAIPSTAVTDFTEAVQDVSGAQLATNGTHTGITAAYDDAGDGAIDLALVTENVQDIVAGQLVTNGSHSGIAATYDDAGDGAIDLNVDDFTITLSGDIGGNVTVTNLGNATLATTVQANSVALGTDSTGNYVATVAGTANEVEVSGSGSETAAVVVGLPNDVTIGNDLAVTEDITAKTLALTSSATALLTVTSTDTGASYGPTLELYRDGTHDGDYHLGNILFTGEDDSGAKQTYGQINVRIEEDGEDAFGDMEFWIGQVGSARIQRNVHIDDYFHSISQDVRIGDGSTYTQGYGALANERIYTGYWAELGHDGNDALTADRNIYFPDASGTLITTGNAELLFDGTTAATQSANDSSTKVATTAFVMTEIGDYAPLASPTLTGVPAAPTASANTNTTQLATTAFVMTEVGDYLLTATAASTYAPLASPTLTGVPAAPTAAADTNTTQIATTAFVMTEIGDYLTTSTASSTYAPIASPTLTGVPAAPTAAADTNTTQIATTAYVQTELGALSSDSITDADANTKIQVEESADENIIRFDTAGTERMSIAADGTVTIVGNLVVNGTETTISSTTITVDDKNIEIGSVASPSDTTADGGGLTLKGATDKTWNWVNSTDAWTSSEHIALATGKSVYIDGVLQLSKNALAATVVLADGVIATTQSANDSSTKVATTAFVMTELADYATLASPTLTGVPAAPTAAADTNTTQIATTAYVQTELGTHVHRGIVDADGDTKIQVEESADEDIIRFDTAGTERMTIGATGIIATTGTNITLANVASPTDLTADETGFTVKGAADYTIKWNNDDENTSMFNNWEVNQNLRVTGDKVTRTGHADWTGGGIEIGTLSSRAANTGSGTAQAGSATTITLAAGSSAVDDFYNGDVITIYYGTGDGQVRTITDYVGSTLVATVAAWTTQPDNTSRYTVADTFYDYAGMKNITHKDNVSEYMIKSSNNGYYTTIGSGNGGYVKINSYADNTTAIFDYGGSILGQDSSGRGSTKFYTKLISRMYGHTPTASYTAVIADESAWIFMNVGSANTFTIPPKSSVNFDEGTMMTVVQYGAGQTTITAGSGVTLIATPGLKLRDQNSVCTIMNHSGDTWLVYGDLDD